MQALPLGALSLEDLRLGDMPDNCVEIILKHLGVQDASRLAAVSNHFRSIATSDSLWRAFCEAIVPEVILAEAAAALPAGASERDLFLSLLDPKGFVFDEGCKRLSIDRSTFRVGYAAAARSMGIVWVDQLRYWTWEQDPSAWFGEFASLQNVYWFYAEGKIECPLPPGTYALSWRLKRAGRSHGLDAVATFNITVGSTGQSVERRATFTEALPPPGGDWGEFVVATVDMGLADRDEEIEFSFIETETSWKSGIHIDCFVIRPAAEEVRRISNGN